MTYFTRFEHWRLARCSWSDTNQTSLVLPWWLLYFVLQMTVVGQFHISGKLHSHLHARWFYYICLSKNTLRSFNGLTHYCLAQCTAQWCVLTISSPLGVGQAPVENSWGTYKIKNVAQKKLALKGTFRLIPYLHKKWSLSTMNLPVQDLIRQKWFFGRCKNWSIQFQK